MVNGNVANVIMAFPGCVLPLTNSSEMRDGLMMQADRMDGGRKCKTRENKWPPTSAD